MACCPGNITRFIAFILEHDVRFTVRGESAVVFIENFDSSIGRRVARENARDQIWQLLGYQLRELEQYSRQIDVSAIKAHADLIKARKQGEKSSDQ